MNGTVMVVRRDRQPLEGRGGPGGPGPQPDARLRRDGGARMSFFRSRWVEKPAHVTELEPDALPKCFCSAGVAAGIKPKGLDVGRAGVVRREHVGGALHDERARRRARDRIEGGAARRAARGRGELRLLERRRRRARARDGARDAARGGGGARARARPGRRRLDGRDRARAAARQGGERRARGVRRAGEGRGRLLRGDPHERRRARSARASRWRCRRARRCGSPPRRRARG